MSKVLFLDDDEERHFEFKRVMSQDYPEVTIYQAYSAEEAIKLLSEHQFDEVHLDHDLGGAPSHFKHEEVAPAHTGYFVTSYMVGEMPIENRPNHIFIHSWNPAGALRMYQQLREEGDMVATRCPFAAHQYHKYSSSLARGI